MDVDYGRLSRAIDTTIEELRTGAKNAERIRRVALRPGDGLEGYVSNGEYEFGVDAARDAGGEGKFARPMDYVLGGLLSCAQMWCLRFAAGRDVVIDDLALEAHGHFTWRGEYLGEVDSGLTAITLHVRVASAALQTAAGYEMLDMVARRCPVFATLRKAVLIDERIVLNDVPLAPRRWTPGASVARSVDL